MLWRLGRALYMDARYDVPNKLGINGELMVQLHLLHAFITGNEKPIVFDVGANIGEWTAGLLEQTIDLKTCDPAVYLFEPTPITFQYLESKIQQYQDRFRLQSECLALSDSNGVTQMFIYGEMGRINSLHQVNTKENKQPIPVKRLTLDYYCEQNAVAIIHFLKCDTEGHDMHVINGARNMFENERIKVCQFEYNHRWVFSRHYLKDVFDAFSDSPYQIGKVTPRVIELFEEWHPELERFFEGNYLIIHKDAISWFPTHRGRFDLHNTYSLK
jgi:FkbM family methyltransferase